MINIMLFSSKSIKGKKRKKKTLGKDIVLRVINFIDKHTRYIVFQIENLNLKKTIRTEKQFKNAIKKNLNQFQRKN